MPASPRIRAPGGGRRRAGRRPSRRPPRGISYDDKVIDLPRPSRSSRRRSGTTWQRSSTTSGSRTAQRPCAENAAALAKAEERYGVDSYIIAAVWGVESDFRQIVGKRPLVQSLATLACLGERRRDYFRGELIATLKIIEQRRHRRRAADRLLGGRLRPDAIHALDLPASRRRPRRRRAARHRRFGGRRARLHGELPAQVRLAARARPGATRSSCPRLSRRRPAAGTRSRSATWASLGVTRIDGRPLSGEGAAGHHRAGRHRGAGLPGHQELRRDLLVQRRRILRPRHRGPVRPAARQARRPGLLADRRPAPVPGRAPRPPDPAGRPGLRCRRAGRQGRPEDPRRDQGRGAQARHDPHGAPGGQGSGSPARGLSPRPIADGVMHPTPRRRAVVEAGRAPPASSMIRRPALRRGRFAMPVPRRGGTGIDPERAYQVYRRICMS